MRDDDGDRVYWFVMEEDVLGEDHIQSETEEDEEGSCSVCFTGVTQKDFDYDGDDRLLCPQCASEECEYVQGPIEDNGIDDEGWIDDSKNEEKTPDEDDTDDEDGDDSDKEIA